MIIEINNNIVEVNGFWETTYIIIACVVIILVKFLLTLGLLFGTMFVWFAYDHIAVAIPVIVILFCFNLFVTWKVVETINNLWKKVI